MPAIEVINFMGAAGTRIQATIKDFTKEVLLEVNKETIKLVNDTADELRDVMKSPGYCPRKTGALAKSIRVRRYPQRLMCRVIIGDKKAFYPHMVIGGTVHTKDYRFVKINGKYVKQKIKPFTTRPNNFPLRAITEVKRRMMWRKMESKYGKAMGA